MTTKIIQVKMNEADNKKIKSAAANVGLAPSSFLRFLALNYIKNNLEVQSQ